MTLRTTNWHQGMAQFAQEADAAFGERLTIIPMVKVPNRDQKPDPSRAVLPNIIGQFEWEHLMVFKGGGAGQMHPDKPLPVSSRNPMATFNKACLPWSLKQADIIKRECTGELFEVVHSLPYSVAQVRYKLRELGVSDDLN